MAFTDLGLVGVQFWVILSIFIALWIIIIVLYAMQRSHRQSLSGESHIKLLTNISAVLGIIACVLTFTWIVMSFEVKKDDLNITYDASSLIISRNNIYTNFNAIGPTGSHINPVVIDPNLVNDNNVCYAVNGTQTSQGEQAHQKFFELAKLYAETDSGNSFITFEYQPAGATGPSEYQDNMTLQRKRTLAYYRHLYCMNQLIGQLLNENTAAFSWMGSDFQTNVVLHAKDSVIPGGGCLGTGTAYANVPDTLYCRDVDWPHTKSLCEDPNPCFTAMMQSFSARCLLYDDQTEKTLSATTAKGALDSFELPGVLMNSA